MTRLNLLFIYTDEQAFNTLAAYGNRQIQMPKLNWLANESVVFDQAYVTQPVCTPSRSSLLTGLYPHSSGCTENNVTTPLPPNFENDPSEAQPMKTRLFAEHYRRYGHSGLPLRTVADWRRMIANYWGLCSLVDTHVGRILDTIDACGLRDSTIVVFTSDHGDMMGAHRLLAKCVMFQEAIRVPMMIRLPGQHTGRRVTGPVSQIDVVPTLLDLLGQPVPDHLQGRSLRSVLESGTASVNEPVLIEWNGPNNGLGDVIGSVQIPDWMKDIADPEHIRAVTTDPVRTIITPEGWKLNCSPLGEHELHNLKDDP